MRHPTLLLALFLAACGTKEDTGSSLPDNDGDGFSPPQDCDDTNPDVSPVAMDLCDGGDEDCDGEVDEDGGTTWYRDQDGDGYGIADTTFVSCDAPAGWASQDGDCDDTTARRSPGQVEVCDDLDNDCDASVDEDVGPSWYRDHDGDGYGDEGNTVAACDAPSDTSSIAGDCDDTDAQVHPGAIELCDGVDDDCDGVVDDGATGGGWFRDGDGDGWGDDATASCESGPGSVATGGDCDDGDPSIHPEAPERCADGLDSDCDGDPDAGAVDTVPWYADGDGDGWGDPSAVFEACAQPSATVADATDCDDTDPSIHPGAIELCNDRTDSDCDGDGDAGAVDAPTWYVDDDHDGFGGATPVVDCDAPAFATDDASDCDDTDDDVFPGALEECGDGVDADCSGDPDDPWALDAAVWYQDGDGDGFGDPSTAVEACDAPTGFTDWGGDCDDEDPDVSPVTGCDDFHPAWYGFQFAWGYLDGDHGTVTSEGEVVPDEFVIFLVTNEWLTTRDDAYKCEVRYTPLLRSTSYGGALQAWQVPSLVFSRYSGANCTQMASLLGADPFEELQDDVDVYTLTVELPDAETSEALESWTGSEWSTYEDVMYSGHLLMDGVDAMRGDMAFYGLAWPVTDRGVVDPSRYLTLDEVEAGVDGYYQMSTLYLWSVD